jgi:hypothetical protein
MWEKPAKRRFYWLQKKKIITAANSEISYSPANSACTALPFRPCKIIFPPAANLPSSSAKLPSSALSSNVCVLTLASASFLSFSLYSFPSLMSFLEDSRKFTLSENLISLSHKLRNSKQIKPKNYLISFMFFLSQNLG